MGRIAVCNYAPYTRPATDKLAQGIVALDFFLFYLILFLVIYFLILNRPFHGLVILHICLNDPGIQPLPPWKVIKEHINEHLTL